MGVVVQHRHPIGRIIMAVFVSDGVLRTAIQLSCPEGGTEVPSSVAEAFKQLLDRLAALEKENDHMAQVWFWHSVNGDTVSLSASER